VARTFRLYRHTEDSIMNNLDTDKNKWQGQRIGVKSTVLDSSGSADPALLLLTEEDPLCKLPPELFVPFLTVGKLCCSSDNAIACLSCSEGPEPDENVLGGDKTALLNPTIRATRQCNPAGRQGQRRITKTFRKFLDRPGRRVFGVGNMPA